MPNATFTRALARKLLAAAACVSLSSTVLARSAAEYAIRWDPAESGPRSIAEVQAALKLPGAGKQKRFEVRYFVVTPPPGTPQDASVIARERSTGGKTESMYKLRSPTPLAATGPQAQWQCPFARKTRPKSKDEVDIGWTAEGVPRKNYSLSCDADGFLKALLPARFEARPVGCANDVLRQEVDHITIERWHLPGDRMAFEVSWKASDSDADLEQFTRRVVRPLREAGAKALQESKTGLGSHC
ncbi:hypothetical protein QTH97_01540 [Variovorax sp. J22R24]|uniref:hypothetical protein n=1 Tax=Variovorax gracilis TaxID=3053502 RepID=UPI002577CD7A|nr:hypothetical protein [Variovorax sp. J22R24]MDM0103598.1 hypothetical protein [Variovorax sp. J22R24]